MFPAILALAACGAAGALIYAFPAYLRAIRRQPPLDFAFTQLAFSIFVGAASASIFTRLVGFHWPWTVQPEPWPLATVVGLASNPLVPILLRRLEGWAENFGGK